MIWLWILAGVVAFDVVMFGALWLIDRRHYRKAGRQLAAMEVLRGVPDGDNAAMLYRDIARQWRDLPSNPPGVADEAVVLVRTQPWRDNEYPKLAGWLRDHQDLIAQLRKATQVRECRVSIWNDLAKTAEWSLYGSALSWMTVLLWATCNDLGEGRLDSAIKNWQSLNGLARHLCQQPSLCHRVFAILVESQVFLSLSPFVVNAPDCSDDRLTAIDSILLPVEDTWGKDAAQIARVEKLLGLKRTGYMPLVERIKSRIRPDPSLTPPGLKGNMEYIDRFSARRLAQRRGMSILIALRRCRNATGRWPASLDELRTALPGETLTDPRTERPFAYALTDPGFTLTAVTPYTAETLRGEPEAIDGDWHIWPPDRESRPIPFGEGNA
jgi:hypothetical protein